MVEENSKSFIELLERKVNNKNARLVNAEVVDLPKNSISIYNLKHRIIENAKKQIKPRVLNETSTDIVEVSNEKEVLRKQISRINREIRELEIDDTMNAYLLDLRRILAGYLKLWLDHEHRTRDLESQDFSDLQKVLTGKLDRLTELAVNWDCEHCATKIQTAFLQVVSE